MGACRPSTWASRPESVPPDAAAAVHPTKNLATHHPATGTRRTQQQPRDLPIFRCRPDLDSGIPIWRESRAWAWETPSALLQEKLKPGRPRRRDIWTPRGWPKATPSRLG